MRYELRRVQKAIGYAIRTLIIFLLFLIGTSFSLNITIAIAYGQETATSHLLEGKRLYDNLDYDKAIIELRQAISQGLTTVQQIEAYEYLALCYVANNDEASARNTFKQILGIAPSYKISENFAPKVRRLFQEAKDEMSVVPSIQSPPPGAGITHQPSMAQPAPLMMRGPKKSPGGALALALLPGLIGVQGVGQWYNGDIGKGFAFFSLGLLGLGLIVSGSETEIAYDVTTDSFVETTKSPGAASAGALIWVGSYLWSAVDAYRSAHRKNIERGYTFINTDNQSRYALSMNHSQVGRDQIVRLTLVSRF